MASASCILVTGGAGFIGSHFARLALARTTARVVVLDKLTYAGREENLAEVAGDPRFELVRGDITSRADVEAVFARVRPTSVVHFAAESHVDRSIDGPRAFVATNVVGTFELLEAARAHVASLEVAAREGFRFLQVSTDEVYGSLGEVGAFTETTAFAPRSPYAATKAAADHLALAWAHTFDLPVLSTHASNNYGPRQHPEKLIPLALLAALAGRDLPIYGDGSNVRDWLHVDDHCEGILLALERGRAGERYNFGGAGERTNLEVIEALCLALEARRPARENPAMIARARADYRDLRTFVADRPGHDRRYAVDASKARRELGWSPRRDFAQGLGDTVDWYLANGAWCDAVRRGERGGRLGLGVTR